MVENPPQDPSKDRAAGASTPQGTRPGFPAQGLHLSEPAGGWDLDQMQYAANGTSPITFDFAWGPDGSSLFVANAEFSEIQRYIPVSPYDITQIPSLPVDTLDVDDDAGAPRSIQFNHSPVNTGLESYAAGQIMIVYSFSEDAFARFELSSPWDITTATRTNIASIQAPDRFAAPPSGEFYVFGLLGQSVGVRHPTVPWGVDIESLDNVDMPMGDIYPIFENPGDVIDVDFGDGGNLLFGNIKVNYGGQTHHIVTAWPLETAYDPSTATAPEKWIEPFLYGEELGSFGSIVVEPADTITLRQRYEPQSEDFTVGLWQWIEGVESPGTFAPSRMTRQSGILATADRGVAGFAFDDDGSVAIVSFQTASGTRLEEFQMGVPYNVNTLAPESSGSFTPAVPAVNPTFNPDGTQMYLHRQDGTVAIYDLSTAYSPETAVSAGVGNESYSNAFSMAVSPPVEAPEGTFQFVVFVNGTNTWQQYVLEEDWDFTSMVGAGSGSFPGDLAPTSIAFGVDGDIFIQTSTQVGLYALDEPYNMNSFLGRVAIGPRNDVYSRSASAFLKTPLDSNGRLFGADGDGLFEWTASEFPELPA